VELFETCKECPPIPNAVFVYHIVLTCSNETLVNCILIWRQRN